MATTRTARNNPRRQEPHLNDDALVDPDIRAANRVANNPGLAAALEKKLVAEEVFIRNPQTKKAHAEKRRADADAHYIAGPRTEQTLADAELARKRSLQAAADTDLSQARTDFIRGPETGKTYADTDLATARRDFVRGVETQKAQWEINRLKLTTVSGIFVLAVFAVVTYVLLSALFYQSW